MRAGATLKNEPGHRSMYDSETNESVPPVHCDIELHACAGAPRCGGQDRRRVFARRGQRADGANEGARQATVGGGGIDPNREAGRELFGRAARTDEEAHVPLQRHDRRGDVRPGDRRRAGCRGHHQRPSHGERVARRSSTFRCIQIPFGSFNATVGKISWAGNSGNAGLPAVPSTSPDRQDTPTVRGPNANVVASAWMGVDAAEHRLDLGPDAIGHRLERGEVEPVHRRGGYRPPCARPRPDRPQRRCARATRWVGVGALVVREVAAPHDLVDAHLGVHPRRRRGS